MVYPKFMLLQIGLLELADIRVSHYQNDGVLLVLLSINKTIQLVIAHENPH